MYLVLVCLGSPGALCSPLKVFWIGSVDVWLEAGLLIMTVCAWMMMVGVAGDAVGCWIAGPGGTDGATLPVLANLKRPGCVRIGMSESMIWEF